MGTRGFGPPTVTVPGTSLRSLPGSLGVIGGSVKGPPWALRAIGIHASRAYSGAFGVIGGNTKVF